MDDGLQPYTFEPVAILKSCYKTKFGIPRQPGLIREARGEIRFVPPYNQENVVRGLDQFSHIWLFFVFHQSIREKWKTTVRPPRLGGDKRVGVFATRSPFRPSPIGLSVVKLERVVLGGHGKVCLEISGLDLLDGTPILDIKPYVPYTDIIPEAVGGFANSAPESEALNVSVSEKAEQQFQVLEKHGRGSFRRLACKVIAADPRPAYQREAGRIYSVFLEEFEVVWQIEESTDKAIILEVKKQESKSV